MINHGRCKLAATAIEALLDGLDCSDDERLTVLANVAAWCWQDMDPVEREEALPLWLALVKRNAAQPDAESRAADAIGGT